MRKYLLHIVLLVLVSVAVYANSIPNSFNFDDGAFVVGNSAAHGFSFQNIKAVFTSVPNGVEYLPVKDLTYMLDYELWGLDPVGYHITNLVFYILSLTALYFLMSRIFLLSGDEEDAGAAGSIAFVATLLYAVHPVHVESVAGISQRKDVVSGFFYFTSLLFYMKSWQKSGGRARYTISLLLFALAGLSKMTAVVMPISVLLLEFYFGPREPAIASRARSAGKKLLRTAPFFILAAAIAALGVFIAKSTGVFTTGEAGLYGRIPGFFEVVFINLKMLLVPYPLVIWHQFDMPAGFFSGPWPLLAFAALAGLVCLIFLFRKKYRLLSFGFAWMLTSMLLVSGLFPTTVVVAERYMFLPSAGFCLALAWTVFRLSRHNGKEKTLRPAWWKAAAVTGAIVIVFSFISIERNADWKNKITLYTADLGHNPDMVKTYICLGKAYIEQGDWRKGLANLLEAKKLWPSDFEYDFYTAYYLYKTGQRDFALTVLENLEGQLGKNIMDLDYLSGVIYEEKGDINKARIFYIKAAGAGESLGVFSRRQALYALDRIGK